MFTSLSNGSGKFKSLGLGTTTVGLIGSTTSATFLGFVTSLSG